MIRVFLKGISNIWYIEYHRINTYNMHNNKVIKTNKPFIFSKKAKDSSKFIPLNKVSNTLGLIRYFPPACQEWSNSIYHYNNTAIKNISIAQKNLTKLLKSYFNLYFNKNLLYSKRILTRFRRLSINRIFISKAELKHTSDKVIITLYVYNEERRILTKKLKRIEAILFSSLNNASLKIYGEDFSSLGLKKRLDFLLRKDAFSLPSLLENIKVYIAEEIKSEEKGLLTTNKLSLKRKKLSIIKNLEKNLSKVLTVISSLRNDPLSLNHYENLYEKYLSKNFLEKEIATIAYYKLKLSLNKYKFEDYFLSRLSPLIRNIYNKEVEFNIINLKAIYLNSDIFTQAMALKLRNRNNRLLRVLRSFLYMVKLPKINPLKERYAHIDIKNLWANKVKNLTIRSLGFNVNRDSINTLLAGLFKESNFTGKLSLEPLTSNNNKLYGIALKPNLLNSVLLLLKNKRLAGVRLEAKGRLTKRFTASRSVFKIKWKGSLKNIDSSYRGLSSVILRGHVKSNVQYSIINSKTRNGAFGLKGWISGK